MESLILREDFEKEKEKTAESVLRIEYPRRILSSDEKQILAVKWNYV